MHNYSLKILGSNELSQQFRKDTKELVELAAFQKVKPVMFIVGELFVDVLIARFLRKSLNLFENWDQEIDSNPSEFSGLFKEERYKSYCDCEGQNGSVLVGDDKQVSEFPIYFDPEEEYMCLIVVDPAVKAAPGESQSKDGHPYYFLKYKSDEILIDFLNNLEI